jgi:hypothetical protein
LLHLVSPSFRATCNSRRKDSGALWLIVAGVGVFYLWLTVLAFTLPLLQ